jgi:hypothetical protein
MTFLRIGLWLGAVCLTNLVPTPVSAWELVGFQQAKFSDDLDTTSQEIIQLQLTDGHNELRLCVEERPLRLREVQVIFKEGSRQSIKQGRLISSGSCSDADLGESKLAIKEIIIRYDRPPGRAPLVKVYAR